MGMENIHTMNAYKSLLAICANGVAVVTFIIFQKVLWMQAGIMITGAMIGGYFGAWYAQKLDPKAVRYIVIAGNGDAIFKHPGGDETNTFLDGHVFAMRRGIIDERVRMKRHSVHHKRVAFPVSSRVAGVGRIIQNFLRWLASVEVHAA